jgi:hypothetical protein
MKDATRTYYIAGAQTLDIGQNSQVKIKKLIIGYGGSGAAFTITVKGTGIFDQLGSGSDPSNHLNVPLNQSNLTLATGFYERKPEYSANIQFWAEPNTTFEIDLGGIELHHIVGNSTMAIYAIAY